MSCIIILFADLKDEVKMKLLSGNYREFLKKSAKRKQPLV